MNWEKTRERLMEIGIAPEKLPKIWKYHINLRGAYLRGAYLRGAYLSELMVARLSVVPSDGGFVAWKKCHSEKLNGEYVIVKLSVPADSPRSNATGRKCRVKFADVLEVIGGDYGVSDRDSSFIYRAGERVECHEWDENRWNECSGGIHCFITRVEAEEYILYTHRRLTVTR